METSLEYCRYRCTEPILARGVQREIDWFRADWRLVPTETFLGHRHININSVEKVVGFVVIWQPLQYLNAEIILLEGVLAQISLIFATPINTTPVVEKWVVTSVIKQIFSDEAFRKTHDNEEEARRETLRK